MGAMGSLGSTYVFSYGDSDKPECMIKTAHCLDTATAGAIRFFGTAAAAMSDYACYGAGIGIQMARADDMGVVQQAWDAAALGIAGVKLTFTGVAGGPKLRAQISIDGLPDDGAYVHGKGTKDIGTDGEAILLFADFGFPACQVTTAPAAAKPFDFTITGATWIDANMMPVTVTPIPAPMTGEGGAGGMGGMGGMGGTGGMGGAGGMGGSGGSGGSGAAGAGEDAGAPTETGSDTETSAADAGVTN
jgi:hypothetical protein